MVDVVISLSFTSIFPGNGDHGHHGCAQPGGKCSSKGLGCTYTTDVIFVTLCISKGLK